MSVEEGGNLSTWGKPMQTCGEHVNPNQKGPKRMFWNRERKVSVDLNSGLMWLHDQHLKTLSHQDLPASSFQCVIMHVHWYTASAWDSSHSGRCCCCIYHRISPANPTHLSSGQKHWSARFVRALLRLCILLNCRYRTSQQCGVLNVAELEDFYRSRPTVGKREKSHQYQRRAPTMVL